LTPSLCMFGGYRISNGAIYISSRWVNSPPLGAEFFPVFGKYSVRRAL
jgi:hypothetical protein